MRLLDGCSGAKLKAGQTGLADKVIPRKLDELRPFPGNPRTHSREQIRALARSISSLGWARPIGIDETNTILFGHGCFAAAKFLGLSEVPTLAVTGLTEGQKRAVVVADNQLALQSAWDPILLKVQLEELIKLDFDVELTGFSTGEIDVLFGAADATVPATAMDDADGLLAAGPAVTKVGDLWVLGNHRLTCGDSRAKQSLQHLLGDDRAEMVVTDPPYNVRVQGHARGRSKVHHREFAMASGEMSGPEFQTFLGDAIRQAVAFSKDGAIHYWFIDWRHLPDLLHVGLAHYTEWKNLLVWRKANAGQGSFYRSHHELIPVFKVGSAPHINNFGLGAHGRYRTNVLDYAGGATPDAKRQEELQMHPTVKPVPLIADLMRDCSRRNGLVLDLFGGSGTALLAAEESSRKARVIELDPLYVDLAVRRWQKLTGARAVHEVSGRTFDDLAEEAEDYPQARI